MEKRILRNLINLSLFGLLVGVILVPSFGGSFLVGFSGSDSKADNLEAGQVAGWQEPAVVWRVGSNEDNFSDLAQIKIDQVSQESYLAEVNLTTFRDQVAVYHQLFAVANLSSSRQRFRVRLLEASPQEGFSLAVGVLHHSWDDYYAVLENDKEWGDTLLDLSDTSLFQPQSTALIGEELLKTLVVSDDSLVVIPLQSSHATGSQVYPGPIAFTPQETKSWETDELELSPREGGYLTLIVHGKRGLADVTGNVSFKLAFDFLP